MKVRFLGLGVLAAFILSSTVVVAQEQDPSSSQPASGDVVGIRSNRSSPRATMRTFLLSFPTEDSSNEGNIEKAIDCLDLSGLPRDLRRDQGRLLAVKLKDVLDRIERIDFETIPDSSVGGPFLFYRIPEGEITIAKQENGQWLFTAETVRSIEPLLRVLENREVVTGVSEAARSLSPGLWLESKLPASLRRRAFLLKHWQWFGLLLLVLIGFILNRLVVYALSMAAGRFLKQRLHFVDGAVLERSLRPIGLLVMASLWWFGIRWLALPERAVEILDVAVRFILAFAGVWVAYRAIDIFAAVLERKAAKTETKFDDLLVPLVRTSLRVFIAAVGLIFIAENLDIEITGLLAGFGIAGMAVALAAQDTVKNLFGSMTVLLDRPFQVGDWVLIGNVEGTIEELGFRSTRIRTFYNSVITIPNSTLLTATIDNLGLRQHRRWRTMISITYDTPSEKIEAFCEGIRELVRRHPYTRKDYFHVYLNEFAPSSLDILLYMFFQTPDWATELRERHRLAVDIIRLADRLGVEFAFPTQTLFLKRPTPEEKKKADGNNYPTTLSRNEQIAREEAQSLVKSALGDQIPPPVSFESPVAEQQGDPDN